MYKRKLDWDFIGQHSEEKLYDERYYIRMLESIFGITTYDGGIDSAARHIAVDIFSTAELVLDGKTYDYINTDEQSYISIIEGLCWLDSFGLIDWGTSIRYSWFSYYDESLKGHEKDWKNIIKLCCQDLRDELDGIDNKYTYKLKGE